MFTHTVKIKALFMRATGWEEILTPIQHVAYDESDQKYHLLSGHAISANNCEWIQSYVPPQT